MDPFHKNFVENDKYHVLKFAQDNLPKQCGINFQTKINGFFILTQQHVTELNFNRFTGETYSVFVLKNDVLEFVEPNQVSKLPNESIVSFVQHEDKDVSESEE